MINNTKHPSLHAILMQFVKKNDLPKKALVVPGSNGNIVFLTDNSRFILHQKIRSDYIGELKNAVPNLSVAEYSLQGIIKGTEVNLSASSQLLLKEGERTSYCRADYSPYWFLTPGSQ